MNKLAISIAISSVLGLTACDDTTLEDVQQNPETLAAKAANDAAALAKATPRVSVVWNPSSGELSVPNDLLLSGTIDGTLEMPDETAAKLAGEPVNFANPSAAIGALDGWGLQNPFSIALSYGDEGLSIDPLSIMSGDAVALYQVEKFPSQTDADCSNTDYSGLICKGLEKLTFGVDYVTSLSGGNIVVVPLKPLKAGSSYAVALTKAIKDNNGNALMPSSTYASVEKDITTTPLVLPSLTADELNATQAGIRMLQTMTNNFENSLADAFDADKEEIIYTQVFTTQSAGVAGTDPLQVTKLLNAKAFAAMKTADATSVVTNITFSGATVTQALQSKGFTLDANAQGLYNTANIYSASIQVPYYLETTETGDPLAGRWEAACDSGAILQSLTSDQLAAGTPGANHATCSAIGLADLGFDTQRHLTKFNPLPKVKSVEEVNVQLTLPNVAAANGFRAAISGGMLPDIAKPTTGWPVVMVQHGITSTKEEMLATTGWLSAMGYATAAIDHPLHGERGFEVVSGDTTTVINTSTSVEGGVATTYFNLASLLTSRDNVRQSVADGLKLRLALNAFYEGTSVAIDTSNVYYMGHSLGAISGVNLVTVANTPVTASAVIDNTIEDETVRNATAEATAAALNNMYKIKAAVFANPGSSIANFLVESGSFGALVKASVVYGLGNDLSAAVQANIDDIQTVIATNLAKGADASSYCQSAYAAVLASKAPSQSDGLICAFDEFMDNATDAEKAQVAAAVNQFAFAAQTLLEAGDPSNYSQLLKTLKTPVLIYEVSGDGTDANLPDQTIPNFTTTDVAKGIAGTTGLANQLGLEQIDGVVSSETEAKSGIVRFIAGSHSTFANPNDPTDANARVHTEMQTMMYQFFNSVGKEYKVTDGCVVKDATCVAPD